MPQEHYVLRCFSCETFQAQIVKKTKKWECKMCGAKQSLKRNYGRGSGKDCRNQVMKLNELRLVNSCSNSNETEDEIFDGFGDGDFKVDGIKEEPKPNNSLSSKWEKYLEPKIDSESEVDDSATDFYTELVGKKKRTKKTNQDCLSKNKKICRDSVTNTSSPIIKNLVSPPPGHESLDNCKRNDRTIEKDHHILTKNTLKPSKYAKFLDENGGGEDVNKSLNIFDSDANDLDSILKLD